MFVMLLRFLWVGLAPLLGCLVALFAVVLSPFLGVFTRGVLAFLCLFRRFFGSPCLTGFLGTFSRSLKDSPFSTFSYPRLSPL